MRLIREFAILLVAPLVEHRKAFDDRDSVIVTFLVGVGTNITNSVYIIAQLYFLENRDI